MWSHTQAAIIGRPTQEKAAVRSDWFLAQYFYLNGKPWIWPYVVSISLFCSHWYWICESNCGRHGRPGIRFSAIRNYLWGIFSFAGFSFVNWLAARSILSISWSGEKWRYEYLVVSLSLLCVMLCWSTSNRITYLRAAHDHLLLNAIILLIS